MDAANRVALNTFILYGRMLLTMGISLYSTRLVLNALGSTDYGIYNLVAGVIVMLTFLNSAMATSTQRYLSFHQTHSEIGKLRQVFTNSFFLHILIGVILVLFLELGGLFLFNGFLNIPENRISSARIIYHYMAVTVFFTVISVPFQGLLIAHENMFWVAIINITESILKLIIALSLFWVVADKLVVFGILTASVIIISLLLNMIYCLRKYPECTFSGVFKPQKMMIKELGKFAGWNMFGALCGLSRVEGTTILLNLFFGAVINAAYAIANQVGTQLLFFSQTMLRALNPQIMKSEGIGDRERTLRLSMMASKFGFFLISIFAIPVIFQMTSILHFWLKEVPPYTVIFCQLVLIGAMTNQLTIGLQSAIQASGDIKFYQLIVGGTILLNLPLSYILLRYLKQDAYIILAVYISIELVACTFRLIILNKKMGLSIIEYCSKVFLKESKPVFLSLALNYLMLINFNFSYAFLLSCGISFVFYVFLIWVFGLEKFEKDLILNGFNKLKNKIL
ncbi:oligosaccharide flippase family protein [Robertkochia solimangrovi]|uniref:oligosaccharide flippase family protein n=1 Tax=Robertkochia solimangrovi TaxID=2213046 RepID=UPI00117FCB3D|nr:oligosaccharide flippase family protein [Robertkochia solimangrovi]TRZ46028.1 hypothetical protein DMZ48_01800 [Robertkochia solimangrovi]